VFLGGTSVFGGTGTIFGKFVASFIIGAINAGIVAIGLTGFWTQLNLWVDHCHLGDDPVASEQEAGVSVLRRAVVPTHGRKHPHVVSGAQFATAIQPTSNGDGR
jgi:hypothetical protein